MHGDRERVGDRVVHGDELALEPAERRGLPLAHLARDGLDAVLLELRLDERERQLGADERDVLAQAQQVRHGTDVVLVAVREDDRLDVVEPVLDVLEVGQDQVDAGLVVLGEQDAAVDDEQTAGVLEDGHVAADLSEPTQCDDAQGAGGQCRRQGELGVRVTHVAPGGIRCDRRRRLEQPGGPQAVADQRELVVGRGDEREAHRALGQDAQHLERGLRGDGLEAGTVECVDRGDDRSEDAQRRRRGRRRRTRRRSRASWRPATWPATLTMPDGAVREQGQQRGVVAGVPGQAGLGDRLGGGVRVAAGVLHGDDAVVAARARRWSRARTARRCGRGRRRA